MQIENQFFYTAISLLDLFHDILMILKIFSFVQHNTIQYNIKLVTHGICN